MKIVFDNKQGRAGRQMDEFMEWLEERIAAVSDIEATAKEMISNRDSVGYRAMMRKKALLLAGLDENGRRFAFMLPVPAKALAASKLRRFSASASTALELDSTFYMSALLFPEDHQPGQPNDLEVFREEIQQLM